MDSTTPQQPDGNPQHAAGPAGAGSGFGPVTRFERLGRMGTGAKVGVATAAAAGLLFGGFGLTSALAAEEGSTTTPTPTQSEAPTTPGEQPAPDTEGAPRSGAPGAGRGGEDCPEPGTRDESAEESTEDSTAGAAAATSV